MAGVLLRSSTPAVRARHLNQPPDPGVPAPAPHHPERILRRILAGWGWGFTS
ncbi:MAG: hypothetical protein HC853_09705 [Anaerolineae bacterium]|nr:hypothetical protein [Anaerolineae bacterium]